MNISNEIEIEELEKIFNPKTIRWAVNELSPYKAPGKDGIFPVLLQKAGDLAYEIMSRMFVASALTNHIPYSWRGTIIHFIPKPGKAAYDKPKSYRPISLMSFILKTMEKIIDKYLRENTLSKAPLNKHQHAYQKGKGTESALHYLVNEIEQFSSNGLETVAAFIDIAGAFDNTNFNTIRLALSKKGAETWTINWIEAMLKSREIEAAYETEKILYSPTRGCPQGGCLSPLLWSVVIDELLDRLENNYNQGIINKYKMSAYADDVAILVTGRTEHEAALCESMNRALKITEIWCNETGLKVSAEKSNYMIFTNAYKKSHHHNIKIFGQKIPKTEEFKYLGVILDSKLSWKNQIQYSTNKGINSLFASRAMISTTWGLTPAVMNWIYKAIITPRIFYGCQVWWHALQKTTYQKMLNKINRIALLMITGATRSTPTKAMEAIIYTMPVDLKAEELALKGTIRLIKAKTWIKGGLVSGHKQLYREALTLLNDNYNDHIEAIWNPEKNFDIIINERNNWSYKVNIKNNLFVWYTDAAKDEEWSGISWYNKDLNISEGRKLNRIKITKAEMLAIDECAKDIINKGLKDKDIVIASDSVTSLRALDSINNNSKTVENSLNVLNRLSANNRLTLVWTPAHSNIVGNIMADRIAKDTLKKRLIDITTENCETDLDKIIARRTESKAIAEWNLNQDKMTHSRRFIKGFEYKKAKEFINLKKKETRVITGVLTGHGLTRSYLKRIGKTDKCRFCNIGREDMKHWMGNCPMLCQQWSILENTTKGNVKEFKYSDLILYTKRTGVFATFFKEEVSDNN